MKLVRPVSLALAFLPSLGCAATSPSATNASTSGESGGTSASSEEGASSSGGTSSGAPDPTSEASTDVDETLTTDPTDGDTTDGGCPTDPCIEVCADDELTIEVVANASATALAFIDADGDDAQELLFGVDHGGLWLLPSAGAGPEEALLPEVSVAAIASGDLDGDGDDDIAASVESGVVIMLNDGTGGFELAATIPDLSGYLEIADLDGEGELDILVHGSVGTEPRILSGQSGLAFVIGDPFVLAHPELTPSGVVIGQFDGEGGEDVALADGDLVSWWFADDTPSGSADLSRRGSPGILTSGDFDGDGLDDAARVVEIESFVHEVQSWRGGVLDAMPSWRVDAPDPAAQDQWLVGALAGDFDGDGHDDLALHYDGWMHIRRGGPGDGFGCIATYEVGGGYLDYPTVGDFDGDGRDDLVLGGNGIRWMRIVAPDR